MAKVSQQDLTSPTDKQLDENLSIAKLSKLFVLFSAGSLERHCKWQEHSGLSAGLRHTLASFLLRRKEK